MIYKVIPLVILAACAPLNPIDQGPQPNPVVVIDHDMATQMVLEYPLDLFTDFGQADTCAHSEQQPANAEPPLISPDDLWQRLRMGFQLDYQNPRRRIDSQFNWYQSHPEYLARVAQRSERYLYHVVVQAEQRGVPMELALLPIVESAYDPFAYSPGRASGMWQFIPGTARMFKLNSNWWYDGRRDVVASTDAALQYLSNLSKYYDGDWLLALAAYNSGQGTVNKAIRKNKKRGKPTDFWSLDLPRETRSYVPKLLALAKLMDNPGRYGIDLKPIANTPYFAVVNTGSQIDLAQAAAMSEIDIDELYRLNPGFNRWATAPSGPHRLLVPISQQALFESRLAQLPASKRLHWQRYTVKNGDSLGVLAKRFNTGADTIRQVNGIKGNMIRAGHSLMIPIASKDQQHYALSAEQRLATIQQKRTGASNSQQIFHRVKSGESLWTISRRYHVQVSKLAHWNGISPKDTLQPGQKLSVWTTKATTTTATVASLEGQREAVVRKVGYKVRNGDSLARIADRFNLRISDILKWNPLNPKKYLQPGQRLTLYINITNAYN